MGREELSVGGFCDYGEAGLFDRGQHFPAPGVCGEEGGIVRRGCHIVRFYADDGGYDRAAESRGGVFTAGAEGDKLFYSCCGIGVIAQTAGDSAVHAVKGTEEICRGIADDIERCGGAKCVGCRFYAGKRVACLRREHCGSIAAGQDRFAGTRCGEAGFAFICEGLQAAFQALYCGKV